MRNAFIQIHWLTSYSGVLLNRDDVGAPKTLLFGGKVRTRISSQCIKRHWREDDGHYALTDLAPKTVRSRRIFEQLVALPLIADGLDEKIVRAVADCLKYAILGTRRPEARLPKQKAKAKENTEDTAENPAPEPEASEPLGLNTDQMIVLGLPEVNYIKDLCGRIAAALSSPAGAPDAVEKALGREGRENLLALRNAGGLGAAMFGRMLTSDMLTRGDAAVHVAHAFTVHGEEQVTDYFSAIDDLTADSGEKGSGHIGNAELTSGLFYGYTVVDVAQLVSNLEGIPSRDWRTADLGLTRDVLVNLIHLIATVSPGAKRGSTAPYSYASLMTVEVGPRQPHAFNNAFLSPVLPGPDLLQSTYAALGEHVAQFDRVYGHDPRRLVGLGLSERFLGQMDASDLGSLNALARWASAQILEG